MSINLQKILKALAKELTVEVTKMVTEQLRETYVQDITTIVKDCLNNSQLIQDSLNGYITIEALCKKLGRSRTTITSKCTQFPEGSSLGISRKLVNGKNLVNEKEYIEASNYSSRKFKPKFANQKKAA